MGRQSGDAKAHNMPHPYEWPKEEHAAWRMGGMGGEV